MRAVVRRIQVMLFVIGVLAVRWSASPVGAAGGPVALWHMDEVSGSVMYDAVGGHNGDLQSVQLGQPGFLGTGYGFVGRAQVTVPSSSDLNPGPEDITVSVRLLTTLAPSVPDWDVIRKGTASSSGGDWKMEYQPSGQVSCGFRGSQSDELIAGPALNDGLWHAVQCVKTASAITVVVDGTRYSKSASIGSISNTDPVLIGTHGTSEYFQGTLDEASIQIGQPASK